MKKCRILSILLFFVLFSTTYAEDETSLRIGIDAGVNYYFSDVNSFDRIRESNDYQYDYCGIEFSNAGLSSPYIGVKPELLIKGQIGLSLGIRLSTMMSVYETDNPFFYWKLAENGTNTDYVKIKKMEQTSYYFEIPFELRTFLGKNKKNRPCRIYLKVGASLGFRLKTNTDVFFVNKSMEQHEDEIDCQIGDVDAVEGQIFAAVGVRLGRNVPINLEFQCPGVKLNSRSSSLVDSGFGVGFQLTVQSPTVWKKIKKNDIEPSVIY